MKKQNIKEVAKLNNIAEIETLMTQHNTVSLRRLAIETETTYSLLLKAARTPVPGTAYNPEAVNYSKIAEFFDKRCIKLADLDWEALTAQADNSNRGKVAKSVDDFEVGSKVFLRDHADIPYDVIYKTETHIVILLEGDTAPRSLSNNTFMLLGPQKTARVAKEDELA